MCQTSDGNAQLPKGVVVPLSRRMRDRYDIFGGLPDTIEDDWIESEEKLGRCSTSTSTCATRPGMSSSFGTRALSIRTRTDGGCAREGSHTPMSLTGSRVPGSGRRRSRRLARPASPPARNGDESARLRGDAAALSAAWIGRGGGIRTHDLMLPKHARCQTAPHPDGSQA